MNKSETDNVISVMNRPESLSLMSEEEQTLSICLVAVKRDGNCLLFVKNKTEEICLAAVSNYSMALRYIENPSKEGFSITKSNKFNLSGFFVFLCFYKINICKHDTCYSQY